MFAPKSYFEARNQQRMGMPQPQVRNSWMQQQMQQQPPAQRGFGGSVGPSGGFGGLFSGAGRGMGGGLGGMFGGLFGGGKKQKRGFGGVVGGGNTGITGGYGQSWGPGSEIGNKIMQGIPEEMPQEGIPSMGPSGGFGELIRRMQQRQKSVPQEYMVDTRQDVRS